MAEQFPNDKINGKERPIVHIWSAKFEENQRRRFTTRATDLLRDVGTTLKGFLEGQVFESDDSIHVIVVTNWENRHAWASALWNEKVDKLLEAVEQKAKVMDIICYPIAKIVPAKA